VFVAARTPREVVARLNRAVVDAVKAPEVVERMGAIGMDRPGRRPRSTRRLLHGEYERFGALIKRMACRWNRGKKRTMSQSGSFFWRIGLIVNFILTW